MRALIVEDNTFIRELLVSILSEEIGFSEIIQAEDGVSGWEAFEQGSFDLIILDLLLPVLDGIQLAKRMLERSRGNRILAISGECSDFTVREVSRSGILGFVCKCDLSREMLINAVRKLFDQNTYYSPGVSEILENFSKDPMVYFKVLTVRELQVVRLIAQRKSHEKIAEELRVSALTVRRHRHNAMKKLGLKNEADLLYYVLESGIVKQGGGLDWTN
jgi:DNA-binding NarL/FixJ family response regulator